MRIARLPGVFRPHTDSWLLAAAVRESAIQRATRVLELCTGSGLVAIRAALLGAQRPVAIDLCPRAVLAAGLNARLNGVRVRALRGDLLAPVAAQRFDRIAANPPYLPAATDELPRGGRERHTEAGRDGRALIDRVLAEAPAHLRPGGELLVVHSSLNGEEQSLAALRAAGLEADVVLRHRTPFGPLLRARAEALETRGLLVRGEREEELVVVRGRAPVA